MGLNEYLLMLAGLPMIILIWAVAFAIIDSEVLSGHFKRKIQKYLKKDEEV